MHTYCHTLTRQVILFCLRQGCGKIRVAVPEKPRRGQRPKNARQLISAPSKFHTLLEYKAKELGIAIVKIDTGNSLYRCNECGHVAMENRKTDLLFTCVRCGRRANADYNAARNICMAPSETVDPGTRQKAGDDAVHSGGTMHSGMVLRPVPRPGAIRGAVATANE